MSYYADPREFARARGCEYTRSKRSKKAESRGAVEPEFYPEDYYNLKEYPEVYSRREAERATLAGDVGVSKLDQGKRDDQKYNSGKDGRDSEKRHWKGRSPVGGRYPREVFDYIEIAASPRVGVPRYYELGKNRSPTVYHSSGRGASSRYGSEYGDSYSRYDYRYDDSPSAGTAVPMTERSALGSTVRTKASKKGELPESRSHLPKRIQALPPGKPFSTSEIQPRPASIDHALRAGLASLSLDDPELFPSTPFLLPVDSYRRDSNIDPVYSPQHLASIGGAPQSATSYSRSGSSWEGFSLEHDSRSNGIALHSHLSPREDLGSVGTRESDSVNSADTDTSESAFFWWSDESDQDEKPTLGEDHPYMRIKNVVLYLLLKKFWECQKSSPVVDQQPTAIAPAPSPSESSSKKRPTASRGTGLDDDRDDDRDDEFGESVKTGKRRCTTANNNLTFACPFSKKDAMFYRGCYRYRLTRIRDVKQHIGRKHQKPIYCPRCGQVFLNEEARDDHAQDDIRCERRRPVRFDGITEVQKRQLSKKAPSNLSAEKQWYAIFDVLFPGHHPRPESPYTNASLLQDTSQYQEFALQNAPTVIARALQMSGIVETGQPGEERDRAALLETLVRDGLQIVFNQWASQNGMSMTTSQLTSTTADSFNSQEQRTPSSGASLHQPGLTQQQQLTPQVIHGSQEEGIREGDNHFTYIWGGPGAQGDGYGGMDTDIRLDEVMAMTARESDIQISDDEMLRTLLRMENFSQS